MAVGRLGFVVDRTDFDAWSSRRPVAGSSGLELMSVRPGFTGHLGLDDVQLIHMRGRVYDPILSRFLSPDPYVQFPDDTQGWNAYSYVLNNPLSYTDPSAMHRQ